MGKTYKAAMVVIGNEILSGRTQDQNISYIARKMVESGVVLAEVRVVPDIEKVIVKTIRDLKKKMDYVFTSGGIGPTHDDITAQSVSKVFRVALETNDEAFQILMDHYGEDEFTHARQKMAKTPVGAKLIPNPVSAAPGFIMENVYVMAGVPAIFQAMVDDVAVNLKGGAVIHSRTVPSRFAESRIAEALEEIQNKFPMVDIGSYPYFKDGELGVNVVLRFSDEVVLSQAVMDVEIMISALEDQGAGD
tara:strand:- start:6927 stop:7670 length:744 start_codon:yes stop_codon:yes gene_type:complete